MLTLSLYTAFVLLQEAQRAAERAREVSFMQYRTAVLIRAQHREVTRVQPAYIPTPEDLAADRRFQLDRLVTPANLPHNTGGGR